MKKIISLVLVLALAVSLCVIPVSAHAGYAATAGETDRFYEALKYVEDNGIFLPEDSGNENIHIWLDGSVTRGEYATWLARFAGVNVAEATEAAFADMGDYVGTELNNAVAWGKENGYINGYNDGNFYPEKAVSREEICALIARYLRSTGWAGAKTTDNITYFVDEEEFSDYTVEEQNVIDCVKYGIIQGRVNGRFDAKSVVDGEAVNTSREQMAAIFFRAAGNPVLTTKAYSELKSNGNVFSVRVNIHYAAVIQIANGPVSASNVAVKAQVAPIPSIGLDSAHVLSKVLKTGNNTELNLADWLDSVYTFEDCTVNFDIDGITFTYDVWAEYDEDGNMTIIAMPSDTLAVHEAWDRMLETVEYTTNNTDGTYGLLTNGTYMQIGTTKMGFKARTEDLVVDSADAGAAKAAFAERFEMTSEYEELLEVYYEAGITAAYGSKKVELAEDILVQVEGIDVYELGEFIYNTYDAYQNGELAIEQTGLDALEVINNLFESLSGSEIDVVVTLG